MFEEAYTLHSVGVNHSDDTGMVDLHHPNHQSDEFDRETNLSNLKLIVLTSKILIRMVSINILAPFQKIFK